MSLFIHTYILSELFFFLPGLLYKYCSWKASKPSLSLFKMCCSPICFWCFNFRSPAHISWKGNANSAKVLISTRFLITCSSRGVDNSWCLLHSPLISYASCLMEFQFLGKVLKEEDRKLACFASILLIPIRFQRIPELN